MKILNGAELAEFIKQRHHDQVAALSSRGITPKLAIVQALDDPVINTYVRLKKAYGADIGIRVDDYMTETDKLPDLLNKLSNDKSVHGIIVQLPLPKTVPIQTILNMVPPTKDVDALGHNPKFEPATPMAIMWLLAGYNVDLLGKKILLIGRGKLVGEPLEKILKKSGHDVRIIDRQVKDLKSQTLDADIIITATGSPAIIYADMIKPKAVVVDAGVASEEGKTVGDLAPDVYKRDDITVTPEKGGVGPLTVCALFENVIRAASAQT